MRPCIVIPHFDHVPQFQGMLPKLVGLGIPLIVVDDGSPDSEYLSLQSLLHKEAKEAVLVRHRNNLGKGSAVMTGLRTALDSGYTHALQVDADGQHDLRFLSNILEAAAAEPLALVCGEPMFDASISGLRKHARKITNVLCRLETLSSGISDALCGFRVYPLAGIVPLDSIRMAHRMGFDPEILVRAYWAGIEVRYVSVGVSYPEDGRSHFRYFADNLEIIWMHTRLLSGMLWRLPSLLRRRRKSGRD